MNYPHKGTLNRIIFKTPLVLWRMGLGSLLSHPALSGNKMLVLTSWGRKSQLPRHTMLSYTIFDHKIYVASGWGAKTDWYKNIRENARVTVQVGRKVYSADAYRVEDKREYEGVANSLFQSGGDSHFQSWLEAHGIEYDLQDLIDKRERVYFVGFTPSEKPGPPPLEVNLRWVWAGIFVLLIVGWLIVR